MNITNRKSGVDFEVTDEQWAEMVKSKRSLLFKVSKKTPVKKQLVPEILKEFKAKRIEREEPKQEINE